MTRNLGHQEFDIQFEHKIYQMQQAGMRDASDEEWKHRKYKEKLPLDLKRTILMNLWPLEGEEKPPRRTRNWEEVSQAITMELQMRGDVTGIGDKIHTVDDQVFSVRGAPDGAPQGADQCRACQMYGHIADACPVKYVERKLSQKERDALKNDAARHNRGCQKCGLPDHRKQHHRLALVEHYSKGRRESPADRNRDSAPRGGKG